jgi:heat shock protein HslJ
MKKLMTILILLAASGSILSACADGTSGSLKGTSWTLVSYGSKGNQTPAAPGIETSLNFGADGQVSGNMGCNGFGGKYTLKDGKIIFSELMSTMMACPEPQMTQESTSFQAMTGTVTYQFNGDTLMLYDASGELALVLVRK